MFHTIKYFLLISAILSCLAAAMAQAETDKTPVFDFPEAMRAGMGKGGDYTRQKIGDMLFDSIHNFHVTQLSHERMSVGLYLGRSVYNNFDVAQSYTVVDSVTLPVTLYSYSVPIGGSHFAFQLGIGGAVKMQNIRQVSRQSWKNFQTVEDRVGAISATEWFKEADPKFADPKDPPYTEIPKDQVNPIFQMDALNSARFSKLWNELSFPARLPLKAEWIDRLDVGEIVTYSGEGFAEFGASFGAFKNLPEFGSAIEGFALNAEYKLFVRGEYRIVILREDEFHVKVKVMRRNEQGRRMGINAESPKAYLFDGFVIFGKQKRFFGMNMIPFNFQRTDAKGAVVEQGFRFDLRNAAAREAYESAVLGRFALADEVAARFAVGTEAPVERMFRRDADEEYSRTSRALKILLYNQDRSSESRSSDAKLVLKDGEHKVYSTVVENRFESKLFLGSRERSVTRATIDFADQVLGIILEGWIEDSQSDGVELNEYESAVESLLRRGTLFPRAPVWGPKVESTLQYNNTENGQEPQQTVPNYGPSSFYFRMDISQDQVDRFIRTSDEDKWKVLEQAFGVESGRWSDPTKRAAHRVMTFFGVILNVFLIPIDLRLKDIEALYVADSIYDNWVAVGQEKDPYKLTKLLGAQFADRVYGFEMMRVFSTALEAEKVPFYLAASNLAFGRINIQDGYFGNAGKAIEEYRKAANIENPEVAHNIDLAVEDFTSTVLDENRVEIRFRAKSVPHVVYFRIDRTGFFHSTEKEIVVLNLGSFQKGENTIVLDKRGSGYSRFLAEAFSEPSNYDVYLGLGAQDRSWGPVAKSQLFYKFAEVPRL